jgi:hypothetical protein
MPAEFETLDPRVVIKLSQTLANRVGERFPARGLTNAAVELARNAAHISDEARSLAYQNRFLQIVSGILFIAGVGAVLYIVTIIPWTRFTVGENTEIFQALQGIDAGIHIIVLTALAMLFFVNWELRAKRRRALEGLQGLRGYAHVVDMHQLNKDPAALAANLPRTRSSPERDLSPQELLRYLDYCSELLSVISKFAALYSQYSRDRVVIETVNDVEQLSSMLSAKIWQKIMIIHSGLTVSGQSPATASSPAYAPAE